MTIQRPIVGFRFAEIQRGDTLQRIAARELGDAARWPELVGYNGLRAPFITDDPGLASDGVLLSGQFIRLPSSTAVVSADVSPEEVFGRDVLLQDGDTVMQDGDFAVAAGTPNLRQALTHRIATDTGELMFHTEYGSLVRRVLGTVNGPTAGILAIEYVKAALALDPRVSAVTKATAAIVGDTVQVDVEVQPIDGKPIALSTTF